MRLPPDRIDAINLGLDDVAFGLHDQIAHEVVDHSVNGFVELSPYRDFGILCNYGGIAALEHAHFSQLLDAQQPGSYAVIDIMIVISDGVRKICQLSLEARLRPMEESLPHVP